MYRLITLELQQRLPGDRVTGTISFSVTSVVQSEGSEVTVPTLISEHRDRASLLSSMSQDSCFSSDEDHSPLISLHAKEASQEMEESQADDIIPVVIATERGVSHDEAMPITAHLSHLFVERQFSEPLLPSTIRQVLYGSTQRMGVSGGGAEDGGHVLLHRHRSLFTRSHDQDTPSLQREDSDPLPPSKH